MGENTYIRSFSIKDLWNRLDLVWNDIHPDVNIIVGINGSGKTTLLNCINDYYNQNKTSYKCEGTVLDVPVYFIRSFDVPLNNRKKKDSPLYQELEKVVFQSPNNKLSFFNYRMRAINYPEERERVEQRIEGFFQLVNRIFEETGKTIEIDKEINGLVFMMDGGRVKIRLSQLSSGEKQVLLLLLTVFLQDENPCVLLLDEPEISLHITWQDRLVEVLRKLNPNCQLIVTTHSPNIFAEGWEEKLVFMDNLESHVAR